MVRLLGSVVQLLSCPWPLQQDRLPADKDDVEHHDTTLLSAGLSLSLINHLPTLSDVVWNLDSGSASGEDHV